MTAASDRIRALNDAFRQTFQGGRVVMTQGIAVLPADTQAAILRRVSSFTTFSKENDPHEEHDFGSFEEGVHRVFWKIDYYYLTMSYGSEDAADPAKTTRVLTVMSAEEY